MKYIREMASGSYFFFSSFFFDCTRAHQIDLRSRVKGKGEQSRIPLVKSYVPSRES